MLLEIEHMSASYGKALALEDVSLHIAPGEFVAVLGPNGAGKSTLLKCISRMLDSNGKLELNGVSLHPYAAHQVVGRGICHCPEGRRLFPSLSVEENLRIGGQSARPGPWTLPRIYKLFPVLSERRHLPATALSGGQQQMCAIGRALMSNPDLLLCDEISLGLAPIIVRDIYAQLPAIVGDGMSLVIVEQDIAQALKAAAQVYCLQEGRIALQGAAHDLTRDAISAAYFGV